MPDNDEIKSKSKRSNSIFSELSPENNKLILDKSRLLSIKSGETLILEGEEADTLYFLDQGRLIVYADNIPIAQISAGEPVGEIAFLTGGKRTATVIATRNCKLLALDKNTFTDLSNDIPELNQSIIKALASRLVANNRNTPELEPKESNVVALIPIAESSSSQTFLEQLINIDSPIRKKWKIIHANDVENEKQLAEWIQNNEEVSNQLILIGSASSGKTEITLKMSEHADKTFLILNKNKKEISTITDLEKKVYESSLLNNVDVVITRESSALKISDTAKILSGRPIHMHHHVALDKQTDCERIQRFIAGKAIGLVLCGGGAFGAAHLGMLKALYEQGYSFDILGGTSAGSAMAALSVLRNTPDIALNKLEEMFISKKAMNKYSLPLYSFLDHKYFDIAVKEASENTDIEDLPINYFAIATNLSRNKLEVLRKGPLWQAVRASCSIPGVLPPYITKDGDVLIDGAVIDNTPIKTLRTLKPGINVIMNFTPLKTWKVNSDYEKIPRGWKLLKHIVIPKKQPNKYYPSIFAILSRTMVTNTAKRFSEINIKEDIFLEPKRLPRMGMMNWKKAREQFNLAYEQMNSALASSTSTNNQIEILRAAAAYIRKEKPGYKNK